MGLGSTAKTLQRVADMGEELYSRLNEVRAQLKQLRDTVEETNDHVASLESEIAEQRAIIEALADERGIDVESVTAEIHIQEAEDVASVDAGEASEQDADGETDQGAGDGSTQGGDENGSA